MVKIVTTIDDYKKLTGVSGVTSPSSDELSHLKEVINSALQTKAGELRSALVNLPEEQKSMFIAALVTCDDATVHELLLPYLLKLGAEPLVPHLFQLTEHDAIDDHWFNLTVTRLIDTMLHVDQGDVSVNARNTRILQHAMQMIPESTIQIKAKVLLCREIDYSAAHAISDYSYGESLDPLLTNRFSGNISPKSFETAIAISPLDYSEYVMLTLGVLQETLVGYANLQTDLNQIRQLYLNTNYEMAIDKIKELAASQAGVLGQALVNSIVEPAEDLVEVEIHKNYGRRFFENRLSQLNVGLHLDLESIDRISSRMIEKHVHTTEQAENAILNISEDASKMDATRVDELKDQSAYYKTKDRKDKLGFSDKSMESVGTVFKQEVYSKNRGMLTSNAPNFYDELSEKTMRNRIVDISQTYGEDVEGYSFSNPRGAFAGSYSGHCFKIVATLEAYMQEYPHDEYLAADINNFLKAVVASYINKGYHGFSEMVDVLKEPHIQKVFSDGGVELDLTWLDNIVENASRDTQEYTKSLCLIKAMLAELPFKSEEMQRYKKALSNISGKSSSDVKVVQEPTKP